MKKFWNWLKNEAGERTLRLDGPIDEESLWGDEITPEQFREELEDGEGDVTVWINSPGGNVFAAAEIYTMLKDYAGKITVSGMVHCGKCGYSCCHVEKKGKEQNATIQCIRKKTGQCDLLPIREHELHVVDLLK